ncbi:MAG: DNA mismatch repair protein MutS [Thermosipho sp. (in: Bacteria)]|nr:DNA mismatch repair protein MutS [Thermosipho sp. (in: thermotogales)]
MYENFGFDFVFKNLNFSSPIGEKFAQNYFESLITNQKELLKNFNAIEKINLLNPNELEKIKLTLSHIPNIENIINKIKFLEILDEIDLFEIKLFSIFSQELLEMLKNTSIIDIFNLKDLTNAIQLLDPNDEKVPTFYIYDSYSPELKKIREQKYNCKDEDLYLKLSLKEKEIEHEICKYLTQKLTDYVENLEHNSYTIGFLDLTIAKAEFAKLYNLSKPKINKDFYIEHKQLFNPEIEEDLKKKNKKFQRIDIKLNNGTQVITGANMGGKTVLLKTIALSQLMFQLGFFVPSENSNLPLFDEIYFVSGDYQDIKLGLSSFASEMIIINNLYKKFKRNKKLLILLDEPARTTNPGEGKAIVKALVKLFNKNNAITVITTHYDNILCDKIRHLRIKGLKDVEKIEKVESFQDYFDYSLEEIKDSAVPKEAIKILKLLKLDNEIITMAEEVYNNEK